MEGFAGILGHERAIGILRRSIVAGRLHHATLIVGPVGVGKRRVADALSRALNCVGESAAQGAPCEACTHCLRIAEGIHPDVRVVVPDTSKARPTIPIAVIRELLREVNYRPYEARCRVIIVDEADALTEEAANALLKTLEEPTGETLFALVTARPQRLLATIRSRCQLVRLAPLPRALVQRHLVEQAGVPLERAEVCAAFSEGSIGKALMLSQEGVLDARREIIEAVAALREADALDVFALASKQARVGNQELQANLESLKTFYRDVALASAGANDDRAINVDLRPLIAQAASELTLEAAIRHIEQIDAVQSGLRAYVDAHLLLEDLFFSLASGRSPRSTL